MYFKLSFSHKNRSNRERVSVGPEHYEGPAGEIYAKVNKAHKVSSSSDTKDGQSSDVLSQSSSQHSQG